MILDLFFLCLDDQLSGLFFLLSSLCILTCMLFHYPSHYLTDSGYLHLRIMKWVYGVLTFSLIFFYLKESNLKYQ